MKDEERPRAAILLHKLIFNINSNKLLI
jgi:hypothetical protein